MTIYYYLDPNSPSGIRAFTAVRKAQRDRMKRFGGKGVGRPDILMATIPDQFSRQLACNLLNHVDFATNLKDIL